jgi:hypothetical protein
MSYSVGDLLFFIGKVAERLCAIEAATGTSGNISVRADNFPVEEFPKKGTRDNSSINWMEISARCMVKDLSSQDLVKTFATSVSGPTSTSL